MLLTQFCLNSFVINIIKINYTNAGVSYCKIHLLCIKEQVQIFLVLPLWVSNKVKNIE